MNIGELLRTAGRISPEQLQAALDYQKANGGSLGHALVTLGLVSAEEVAKLLSGLYGVPWIDLDQHEIDPAAIRMIPREAARKHQVLPLAVSGKVLTLAMADPIILSAIDDVSLITGCNVKPVVASESALEAAIDRCYGPVGSSSALSANVISADEAAELQASSPGQLDASPPEPSDRSRTAKPSPPAFLHSPKGAVWSLVAVNVVVFGLELLWGGSSSPLTLHRMGAGLGRAGLASEPWRVLSAAFLHVNVVHLALNMWALAVFGWLLDTMLGPRRFIVLYGLSALGGGLASSLVHAQILSAGASGAVWGLMTAQIALIVRLKREHGPGAVPVPTSTLMKPLVINFLFSLLPFVDLSAHLGGGVVGAGLILSGLMWGPRPAAVWRPAAWAASLAMAGCLALALAHGRPWELRWPPPLVPRAIAGTPVTVPVPRGLQPRPGDAKNDVVFGDYSRDPLVVYCQPEELEAPCADPKRRACLANTARDVAAKPLDKGWSEEQSPRVVQLHARPAVFWAIRAPSGAKQMTWVMLEGPWRLRLDFLLYPDAAASWAGLPSAIAEGVTMPPAAP
jgi:membrane associated rhomboid family serine protease